MHEVIHAECMAGSVPTQFSSRGIVENSSKFGHFERVISPALALASLDPLLNFRRFIRFQNFARISKLSIRSPLSGQKFGMISRFVLDL